MKQFELKKEFFTDYGLANAVFDQLKDLPGWRFPENSSDTLVWESSFNVTDNELNDFGPLSLLVQIKLGWNPITSEQFASYTVKYHHVSRWKAQVPKGSEWIEVGKRWELEEALRNLQ